MEGAAISIVSSVIDLTADDESEALSEATTTHYCDCKSFEIQTGSVEGIVTLPTETTRSLETSEESDEQPRNVRPQTMPNQPPIYNFPKRYFGKTK